jgi:hypothetical protein
MCVVAEYVNNLCVDIDTSTNFFEQTDHFKLRFCQLQFNLVNRGQ